MANHHSCYCLAVTADMIHVMKLLQGCTCLLILQRVCYIAMPAHLNHTGLLALKAASEGQDSH